ncbi:DUF3854 domain-containing protein [Acidithiobacillus ferrooxidans]|uniref:DUF3854 domain-containing protein n=1 Tax=Acidithiobacillus ferrooxidans TaxID=920 RepID=UPI001C067AE1|nr:DUF3854 domain-containing protein [Acidithiobacillus ferrooxidans]MBU2772663.1 DUF3854 domain-containing protein [Acidithiobacillus ferrooxidans]
MNDAFEQDLARSGLTPDDVPSWSVVTGAQATADLGRGEGQRIHCDCIKIPYLDLDGSPILDAGLPFARYRLLQTEVAIGGKYLSRSGSGGHIYVPSRLRDLLTSMADADKYLVAHEGEKKAEALVKAGIPAVGLAGITLWHDVAAHRVAQEKAEAAGKKINVTKDTPINPELLALIQELGVKVVVAMGDSDGMPEPDDFFTPDLISKKSFKVISNKRDLVVLAVANASVFFSVKALAGALRKAGFQGTVMFCPWAEEEKSDGTRVLHKQGADDWLLADGAEAVKHAVEQRVAENQEKTHARPPRAQNTDFTLDGRGFIPLGMEDASNAAFWSLRAGEIYETNLTKITNAQGLLPLVPLEAACDLWPKYNEKTGEVSVNVPYAVDDLMTTSLARGRFSLSAVRGAGCWPGENPDELVVNGSDGVFLLRAGEQPLPLAPCDSARRTLYVTRPVAPLVLGGEFASSGDIMRVVKLLQRWSWARPRTDPLLLTGWLLMQAILGAIDQRPHAFVTGESGAGKSTLVNVLRDLLRGSLVYSNSGGESSTAGVRQRMSPDAITLILDEFEPDDRALKTGVNQNTDGIFKLLRTAHSAVADKMDDADGALKGTKDGRRGQVYRSIFSCLMAGIQIAKLAQADRNRLLIFELLKVHAGEKPVFADAEMVGRGMRRLMWSRWPLWESRVKLTLEILSRHAPRADNRTQETLSPPVAALLCCLFDNTQDAEAEAFFEKLAPILVEDHILNAGGETDEPDQEKALRRLLSANLPVEHPMGGKDTMPIAKIIVAAGCYGNQASYSTDRNDLALYLAGMTIKKRDNRWWLFVARGHSGLDTAAKAAGYAAVAITQLLARLPGAEDSRQRVGPSLYRGVMIPVEPLIFQNFAEEMQALRDSKDDDSSTVVGSNDNESLPPLH